MRNGADVGVTADRVSQHEINRKSMKPVKKMLNRGLKPFIERHLDEWFPNVDQEITAGMILPLIKDKFPHADVIVVGSVMKGLHDAKVITRIGGNRSGTYQRIATKVVNVMHVPDVDELADKLLSVVSELIQMAKERNLMAEKARKYDELMKTLAGMKLS